MIRAKNATRKRTREQRRRRRRRRRSTRRRDRASPFPPGLGRSQHTSRYVPSHNFAAGRRPGSRIRAFRRGNVGARREARDPAIVPRSTGSYTRTTHTRAHASASSNFFSERYHFASGGRVRRRVYRNLGVEGELPRERDDATTRRGPEAPRSSGRGRDAAPE